MVHKDSNTYILKCAREIHTRAIKNKESRSSLMKDYVSFYETYPKVFDGCLERNFDFKLLEFMLDQRGKITNDTTNVNNVDADVIGKLKEVYVNPLLEKLNIPVNQAPNEEIVKNFERSLAEAMANIPK